MANKVKMLEDKLSGSTEDEPEHAADDQPMAVAPVATRPIPYGADKKATKADQPPYYSGADDDDETSFSNNRPPTASSYHGARPKTGKAAEDTEAPDVRRPSLALPSIAE